MTSREFSKLIGLSQSTISRSLNGKPGVSDEKRRFVLEQADKYGFELNAAARALKMNKTNRVGVFLGHHFVDFDTNLYMTSMYVCVRRSLLRAGYMSIPIYGMGHSDTAIKEFVLRKEIDGLIILSTGGLVSEDLRSFLIDKKVPNVGIYAQYYPPQGISAHIICDYETLAYQITRYILDKGHTKIAFCSDDFRSDISAITKYKGLEKALRERGLSITDESCFSLAYTFGEGRRCVQKNFDALMQHTVIFCHNDASALGMAAELTDRGVKIPDDMGVVCIGNIAMTHWWKPHITNMDFDLDAMGDKVAELFIGLLDRECVGVNYTLGPVMDEQGSV